ncbi:MAG: hypothetical protein FWC80_03375 [Firmicutes bacterium]|nr:hypothetical protein [Bacillota bacterium]
MKKQRTIIKRVNLPILLLLLLVASFGTLMFSGNSAEIQTAEAQVSFPRTYRIYRGNGHGTGTIGTPLVWPGPGNDYWPGDLVSSNATGIESIYLIVGINSVSIHIQICRYIAPIFDEIYGGYFTNPPTLVDSPYRGRISLNIASAPFSRGYSFYVSGRSNTYTEMMQIYYEQTMNFSFYFEYFSFIQGTTVSISNNFTLRYADEGVPRANLWGANVRAVPEEGVNAYVITGVDANFNFAPLQRQQFSRYARLNGQPFSNNGNFNHLPDGVHTLEVRTLAGRSTTYTLFVNRNRPTGGFNATTRHTNQAVTFTSTSANNRGIYRRHNGGAWVFEERRNTSPNNNVSVTVEATTANNGLWEFRSRDVAGLSSDIYTIIIDTIPPEHNALPEFTNSSIVFSPTDANLEAVYVRHGVTGAFTRIAAHEHTITATNANEGAWYFRAVDRAGNMSTAERVILSIVDTFGNQEAIYNSFRVSYWYNVVLPARVFTTPNRDIAGTHQFASRAVALDFAIAMEWEFRVSEVPGGWIYVSATNEAVSMLYTDREQLDAVVLLYANRYITARQHMRPGFQPTQIHGENLIRQDIAMPSHLSEFADMSIRLARQDFIFTRLSREFFIPTFVEIQFIADDFIRISGSPIIPVQFGERIRDALNIADHYRQGYFLVTERDVAGNIEQYIIYISLAPPTLRGVATFGDGREEWVTFNSDFVGMFDGTLQYITLDLRYLTHHIDNFKGMHILGRNLDRRFVQGEELPILDGIRYFGRYTIELYDRSFNVLRFEVVIAGEPPRMITSSLTSEIELRITIVIGDNFNALTSLQLFRIRHDGTFVEMEYDHAGSRVEIARLQYIIREGGRYTVRMTDLFGRIIEPPSVFYMKGLPTGVLSGVQNGGITNRDVSLRFSGNYALTVFRYVDGARTVFTDTHTTFANHTNQFTTTIMATIENSAEFVFFLYDPTNIELFVEFRFTINLILPEVRVYNVAGNRVTRDGATNTPFYLRWDETVRVSFFNSNMPGGELTTVSYSQGTILNQDALYTFIIRDNIGNEERFTILLHSFIRYEVVGEHRIISPHNIIARGEVTVRILQAFNTFLIVDSYGTVIDTGGTLTADGVYTVYVADNFGNFLTITIEILTTPPVIRLEGVANGEVTNGIVTANIEGYERAWLIDSRGNTLRQITDGEVFDTHGAFRIMAEDRAGNRAYASFEIDRYVDFELSVPNFAISGERVTLTFLEELSSLRVTRNGEEIDERNRFDLAGHYIIEAVDMPGNFVRIEFTIIVGRARSITLPTNNGVWSFLTATRDGEPGGVMPAGGSVTIEEHGMWVITFIDAEGRTFNLPLEIDREPPTIELVHNANSVQIRNPSKSGVTFSLERNGQPVELRGNTISNNGSFRLVVTDDIGNYSVHYFEIAYRLNAAAIILITIGCILALVFAVVIIKAIRKPKVR